MSVSDYESLRTEKCRSDVIFHLVSVDGVMWPGATHNTRGCGMKQGYRLNAAQEMESSSNFLSMERFRYWY